ncbi:MAG: ATP-dependent DNA helicase RecG [Candidatus Levybacteria bacterium RIFCSPLOWO2_01_FULL_38_21]|nr:MAG: ATP-dependent DNA helicase RecG [Candidatus Levybacteria bacterium RIFCSPLOWO2_01_FULL_38_21]
MNLETPIKEAGIVFKKYASRLEKLGIKKIEDFLYHIPFRYEDYSLVSKIADIQPGEIVTIEGIVTEIKNEFTKRWKNIQKAKIADDTGSLSVVWFNQPFIPRIIKKGDVISLAGKVDWFKNKTIFQSPEYEVIYKGVEPLHTGRLVPVYNETRGISSKWLRRQISKIIKEQVKFVNEHIPDSILKKTELIGLKEAIEQIHFPKSLDQAEKAKLRLSFDELFLLQLAALLRRGQWKNKFVGSPFSISKYKKDIEKFWSKLPFELTNAQKKAVKEIFADLASKKPMNRLLEGDVGSGKTVVASIAMFLSYLNGFQSALMAPTEILAQQHYDTISGLLVLFGAKVGLATGSRKYKGGDDTDILVGTHAVLSKKINFKNLGLVVIDEQQRFGVEQRGTIRRKGLNPHLLTITATPIPRTVALTLYGDLDLSFLDEMPRGRKKVKTWLIPKEKREDAYKWIAKEIMDNKGQVFIICPFIEESETMATVKAAKKEFEYLRKEVFSKQKLELLHGKLKSKEKDIILDKFKKGQVDILVATPVVEVGIDIPNATIMLIEAAERFGLSQLHQLRGRVGRSNKQSYCLLFTDSQNPKTIKRLKSMQTLYVGAELAELDLKLRGPGEIYGTAQHGIPILKIASFSDFSLIEKTRKEAESIFPHLSDYPLLFEKIKNQNTKQISPD